MGDAYRKSGVDIQQAQQAVQKIQRLAQQTYSAQVLSGIGGFAALFELPMGYQEPVLVSATDGVGTKLLLAQEAHHFRALGQDLVAMCVNDIAVLGAKPLYFLDYFATGVLNQFQLLNVVEGVTAACQMVNCSLVGGETAEMPDLYQKGHFDMAGFVTGIVEKSKILTGTSIKEGDRIVGFSSNGLHANGFSLIRKIIAQHSLDVQEVKILGEPLLEILMRPTQMYVSLCQDLIRDDLVHALAHITGGGIPENLQRILPANFAARIQRNSWEWPAIFTFLQDCGQLSWADMIGTFNCGIALMAIAPKEKVAQIISTYQGMDLGEVVQLSSSDIIEGNRIEWL